MSIEYTIIELCEEGRIVLTFFLNQDQTLKTLGERKFLVKKITGTGCYGFSIAALLYYIY